MTIHENLAAAWAQRGLQVVSAEPLSGTVHRPNPTAIKIQLNAQTQHVYRLFAWNITHEGQGRSGNNLRVQATSFGKANSPVLVDRSVLCVGWSGEHGVYVGFDPWVKRNPGSSSSVHIKRSLVEEAEADGLAYGGHIWDPRIAFTAEHAEELLPWSGTMWNQRTISVKALEIDLVGPDHSTIRVDPWSSTAAWGVRPDDRLAVFATSGAISSDYLWRVQSIEEDPIVLDSGINRFHYIFTAVKSAKVTGQVESP